MSEETAPTLGQKLSAEALGTFVLVFFGCGTALASGGDYVATALAFGLTVLTMAYAVGHISGGHFNPAVSLGAAVSGRMGWKDAGIYAAVQVGAGVAAGLTLLAVAKLYSVEGSMASVSNQWDKGGSTDALGGFLIEMIGTAVFVFIILAVTDNRREGTGIPAPIAIGLALTLMHLAIIGFTGTSVNPARSLGPGLFAGWDVLQQQWLFILAPLTGAALAGFGYPAIFGYDRARAVHVPQAAAAAPQQWAGGEPQQAWEQPQPSWEQPGQPGAAPQQWAGGQPEQQPWDAEDGRTQIRPPDGQA